jgi:AraC-like DNA-binding protein
MHQSMNALQRVEETAAGWEIRRAELVDRNVARALDHIHDRPAHAWTLRELARESGMSRSVLAERFHRFVGVPPMLYLARWRMLLAAAMLSTSSLKMAAIAEQVGYASETAFSRAYKRWAGVGPAAWRRRGRDGFRNGLTLVYAASNDAHFAGDRVVSFDGEPLGGEVAGDGGRR